MPTSTYTCRLGRPHFAHLRAVVQGVPAEDAAERYLAADSRPAARAGHTEVVQLLRAIVRRRGDPRWRLVGLVGLVGGAVGTAPGATTPPPAAAPRPTLEQWADARGIDVGDWGERELVEMYEADCPPASPAEQAGHRRAARAARLRDQQLQLLFQLEPLAAEVAQPSDLVDGWFGPQTAEQLKRAGLLRLDELQQRIARGGRWYRWVPSIGATKAERIAKYLQQLLPSAPALPSPVERGVSLLAPASCPAGPVGSAGPVASPVPPSLAAPPLPGERWAELDGGQGMNRSAVAITNLQANNDREALEAWILATAGEPGKKDFVATTAKSYRLEAERLLLWCLAERHKPLSSMTAEDCAAYRDFLGAIPEAWISRRRARRLEPGWTPFAGQLTITSRRRALTVVKSLFKWLVTAHYLHANPWLLVKTRLGDDPRHSELDSRAFTPAAWSAIVAWVEAQPASPAQARTEFLLHFGEAVGLRAQELISAELRQLRLGDEGWVIEVQGKGSLARVATVPSGAVRALNKYLRYRGLAELGQAPPDVPLVASVEDGLQPIGYRSLYDSLSSWFRRAIAASALTPAERDVALRATPHWLRHTCGTRALERGVTLQQLQRHFGHADPATTSRYSKAQLQQRQRAFERAFAQPAERAFAAATPGDVP